MELSTDFLIVGGGISGLLTARELRLAGYQVTLVDQSALGQESSWAGGGILLPLYPWRQPDAIARLVQVSIRQYPTLSAELFEKTGIDPEWYACGLLSTQNPDHTAAWDWCERYGVRIQSANAEQLPPALAATLNPLWLPDVAQVRNPRLLKSLISFLKQIGVLVIEYHTIKHLEIQQNTIQRVHAGNSKIKAGQVLLCAGAWSQQVLKQWLPDTDFNLSVQPVRGQMLLFDAEPDMLSHMILHGEHYLIPRRDGKILAGSTVERTDFEKTTTDEARQILQQFATNLLPSLNRCAISHHWAGLRPGSPEGIPFIGRHPEIKNLAINAGHFRNGLVMGPASAQLLADILLNRPTAIDPQPYAPTRSLAS